MADQYIEDSVLKLVKDQWEGAKPKRVQITNRFPEFVQGSFYVVSVYLEQGTDEHKNIEEHENYVYVVGDKLRLFRDVSDLANGVGKVSTIGSRLLD